MGPSLPEWVVLRPRLLERVSKGSRGRLTLVTGPPGCGKTVTVGSWAATERRPCGPIVWLTGEEALGEHGTVEDVAERLARMDTPVVLVLDDFGPDRGSALADRVTFLLRHAGPGLHIIAMARSDPLIPLRRYALAGQLTELRADDLAFGPSEIAAVLAQHGVRLAPEPLRALGDRTEGWAAGVRLAAMSMESHPDPEAFVARFAGDDQAVVEYLVEEVLDAQPAGMRHLLLATSVVDRVNAELAARLAGDEVGRGFAELVRGNAFVTPLGDGWYRYHRMFREALRLVLRHESPAAAPRLNRRAAAWFDRHDDPAEAVRQAVRAGDWGYASWMVVDRVAIGRVLGLRPADSLAGPFQDMPGDEVFAGSEPEPAVVAAAAALSRGDERACAAALQHADRLLRRIPAGDARAARLCADLVRLARYRPHDGAEAGDLASAAPELGRFLDRDDRPELNALLVSSRAATALHDGRLDEAARLFGTALDAATRAGGDYQRRSCLGHLALIEALLGRFAHGAALAGRAARLPEVSVSPAGRRTAAAHLASACVSLERYELGAAEDELEKAALAVRDRPDLLMAKVHRLISARVEIARGRPRRAVELLDGDGDGTRRVPWLERRMRLVAAEAATAQGAGDDARVCAERAGGAGSPGSAVALAQAELCRGEPGAAQELVRHALPESAAVPADVRVEAWLLDARLAYDAGDQLRGRRSLQRALRLAERELMVLPLALARTWLNEALRRDPDLLRLHRGLLGPLHLNAGPPGDDARAADLAAVEALSAREVDVLRRLALMMTTEEIGADLCLSINTIKTHLKSIYRKLGVTRRGEAVRRARRLSLLED